MRQALLVVDYSNDFIDGKGVMSCGAAGQALDSNIAQLITQTLKQDGFVFVCNDSHCLEDAYDPEALLFPPHNITGTWGEEIYGESGRLIRSHLQNNHPHVYYLPKTRYSAFAGTPLQLMLHDRNVGRLIVVGVCTDICVLHTVIDAFYRGYLITVPKNACAALTEQGQEWALEHMRGCLSVEIL